MGGGTPAGTPSKYAHDNSAIGQKRFQTFDEDHLPCELWEAVRFYDSLNSAEGQWQVTHQMRQYHIPVTLATASLLRN